LKSTEAGQNGGMDLPGTQGMSGKTKQDNTPENLEGAESSRREGGGGGKKKKMNQGNEARLREINHQSSPAEKAKSPALGKRDVEYAILQKEKLSGNRGKERGEKRSQIGNWLKMETQRVKRLD